MLSYAANNVFICRKVREGEIFEFRSVKKYNIVALETVIHKCGSEHYQNAICVQCRQARWVVIVQDCIALLVIFYQWAECGCR